MCRLFPCYSCLLLGLVATTQADPVNPLVSSSPPAASQRAVTITVPPVPRPVNPPPEYLLTPPVPPGSGPVWRAAQEPALREAMFRYLFQILPPGGQQKLSVYFLSIRGFFPPDAAADIDPETIKDPDAALLNRFHGNKPLVQPVSKLIQYKDWRTRCHRHWIIYRVSSFQWASDAAVQINAGSMEAGSISSNNVFLTLVLRNGWWEITGTTEISA